MALCESFGKTLAELIGKTDYDYAPFELADKYQRDDRRVRDTGKVFEDIEEFLYQRRLETLRAGVESAGFQFAGADRRHAGNVVGRYGARAG